MAPFGWIAWISRVLTRPLKAILHTTDLRVTDIIILVASLTTCTGIALHRLRVFPPRPPPRKLPPVQPATPLDQTHTPSSRQSLLCSSSTHFPN